MNLQKRLNQIGVLRNRLEKAIDKFMTDIDQELRGVHFGPTILPPSAKRLVEKIPLAGKRAKRVTKKIKVKFLKLALKPGAHPFTLAKKMHLNTSTINRWLRALEKKA